MLTTPKIASHSVSAKATKRKPIADRIQQARTRELYLFKKKTVILWFMRFGLYTYWTWNGINGTENLTSKAGIMSASKIAPVEITLQLRTVGSVSVVSSSSWPYS